MSRRSPGWSALWLAVLTACGLKDLLPGGPVLGPYERTRAFPGPAPSGVAYVPGEASTPFPALPVQLFGVAYDIDLAWRSTDPAWDMHELALLRRPEGPVWIAKEARAASKAQIVTADLPGLATWLPEVSVERHRSMMRVDDRSSASSLDIDATWTNPDGLETRVRWLGPPPHSLQRRRNGNTMGHSADAVMVALDLSHLDFGRVQHVVGGEKRPLERILGLVPFATALVQTQGGLSIGRWRQEPNPGGFDTVHEPMRVTGEEAGPVRQTWRVTESPGAVLAETTSTFRTLRYHFLRTGDLVELHRAEVLQWDRPSPTAVITFQPCLPDLRREFVGEAVSRWVLDVNGQEGHATGEARARASDGLATVDVNPDAPDWVASRPMRTTTRRDGDALVTEVVRR
jgi:hypothetical protein